LVDELRVIIARPLVVGGGKRLFLPEHGALWQLRLIESQGTHDGRRHRRLCAGRGLTG
jgi:hypothetical protein